jgi:hypothetical protein
MGFLGFGKKKKKAPAIPESLIRAWEGKAKRRQADKEIRDLNLAIAKAEAAVKLEKAKMKLYDVRHPKPKDDDDEDDNLDGDLRLSQLPRLSKQLKAFGLSIAHEDGSKVDDGDGWLSSLKPLARELGAGLAVAGARMAQGAAAGAMAAQQQAQTVQEQPAPYIEQQPQQIAAPAAQPQPQPESDTEQPEEFEGMTAESAFMVASLMNKNPQQAALWIKNQGDPRVQTITDQLGQVDEGDLPSYLSGLAQQVPVLADFATWALKQPRYSQWTVPTIRYLKSYSGGPMRHEAL